MNVVIMGVGNELAGDDGIGIAALRALRSHADLPAEAELLEVGTAGPAALSALDQAAVLVVLDAVRAGGAPGTIHRLDLAAIPPPAGVPLSVHDLGLPHLLAEAKLLGRPLRGVLIGMEPGRIALFDRGLSPEAKAALPRFVDRVLEEVRRLCRAASSVETRDSARPVRPAPPAVGKRPATGGGGRGSARSLLESRREEGANDMAKSAEKSEKKLFRGKQLGSAKLIAALNQQVGNELHASLQYTSIAAHFDRENLPRLAQFFHRQADEERMHAMKFVRFISDLGGVLRIPPIGSPRPEFGGAAEAVSLSLQWEHTVTGQIYDLVDIAKADRNYIANRFLDWFVSEQLEEMTTMETLLSLVERAGEDNLLLVEEYLGENGLAALSGGESPAAE